MVIDIILVKRNVVENGNQLFFFVEENGWWRITVSRLWRKMATALNPTKYQFCEINTFTNSQSNTLWAVCLYRIVDRYPPSPGLVVPVTVRSIGSRVPFRSQVIVDLVVDLYTIYSFVDERSICRIADNACRS
jgi:hypothetical protein